MDKNKTKQNKTNPINGHNCTHPGIYRHTHIFKLLKLFN